MTLRKILLPLLLPLALTSSPAFADRAIQQVLADVAQYEKQLSGQSHPNKNQARRILKLLKLREQTLDGMANKNSPEWVAASQRVRRLRQALEAYLQQPSSSTTNRSAPMPASRPAQPPSTQTGGGLISQDRVRLKKLVRDIDSSLQSLQQAGAQAMQDPGFTARQRQRATHYQQQLKRYSAHADDPDVQAANAALQRYLHALQQGQRQAQAAQAQLGDVQARLREIDHWARGIRIPAIPDPMQADTNIKAWWQTLQQLKPKITEAMKELDRISAQAHLPNNPQTVDQGAPYDRNDVRRMQTHLQRLAGRIDERIRQLDGMIQANLQEAVRFMQQLDGYDPSDPNHRNRFFFADGRAEETTQRIRRYEELASTGSELAKLQGKQKQYQQRQELAQRLTQARQRYLEKYERATKHVTLPEPASEDGKLLAVARETLAKPKYGVGKIERMVINAPLRELSKETSEEQYDSIDVSLDGTVTLKGTRTTYRYEWKEFQVATAEQESDGRYYLYYNTLKYFTSGSESTPLNRWVLAKRFRSSPIPKENIHR